MRLASFVIVSVVFLVAPSCGGSSFSSSSDGGGNQSSSSSGGGNEGGTRDGGQGDVTAETSPPVEAGPIGTYCGPDLVCTGTGMQQGTVCCVTSGNPPSYGCAGASCGCETQLDCASDADCSGTLRCCIRNDTGSCAGGHYVARCSADCIGGSHMCVPRAGQCLPTQTCSMDTSSVGLPPQSGFGICI